MLYCWVLVYFLSVIIFEVINAGETCVADADAADFARGEGLHLLPSFGVVPVAEDVAFTVGKGRELFVVSLYMLVYIQ